MATENKGIYFTELTLKNVRCFGDEAILKLSNDKGGWTRWNVILGDNGTGKTTLLQCLAGFEFILQDNTNVVNSNDSNNWIPKIHERNNELLLRENRVSLDLMLTLFNYNMMPEHHIKYSYAYTPNYTYTPNKATTISRSSATILEENDIFIIGYGASRRISFQILSEKEIEPEISATLFDDDAKLISTEEWLLQMDYAASRESEIKELAIKRRNLIIDVLIGILPDVDEIQFKNSTNIEKPVPRLEFKTPYGWVGIKELSFGYKTMVAWMVDLAARMFKQYPKFPNPLSEPVIILVDEIDLHLHPKWQRQIFEFLQNRFPRAQFIVTAHSPLIVQSAPKDANIIVLKKEQVGDEFVVRIDNDIESVRNWRIDQIMSSDIFGIEGSRNPEIEKGIMERRDLLLKRELTEDEKKRLEELNKMVHTMPVAESKQDIEAMDIIRKAADFLKTQQK